MLERADGARGLAARWYRMAAGISPDEAAKSVVQAAVDPALQGTTARFLRAGKDVACPWRDIEALDAILAMCQRQTRVRPDFDSSVWREDDSVVLDPRMLK